MSRTLIDKIIKVITESDHEVVLPLVHVLLEPPIKSPPEKDVSDDYYVELVKDWLDDLQAMMHKADKVDDMENNIAWIDQLIDNIDYTLSDMRNYTDV